MKTSNYLYISYSQMYGMLYGMHSGGCLDNMDLEDAQDIARCGAYDIVTGYDCILEAIHENLDEEFGYDETPKNPVKNILTHWKMRFKKNADTYFLKSLLRAKRIGMKWKITMSSMKII